MKTRRPAVQEKEKAMDAIVYTSNAGHTETYAKELAKRTGLCAYELKSAEKALPVGTEIIYLGWIMAGSVMGYKDALKRFTPAAVAAVGMGVTSEKELRKKDRIPEETPVFLLKGGFEMDKLRGFYKLMMRMMRAASKGQKAHDAAAEALLKDENAVNGETLKELIALYTEKEKRTDV